MYSDMVFVADWAPDDTKKRIASRHGLTVVNGGG
jgi:hypothetical protein